MQGRYELWYYKGMSAQNNSTPDVAAAAILNVILEDAARKRASDVHIEPLANKLRIRFRIDGRLEEQAERPLHELETLLNRVRAISSLDYTSRLPQDGHFELTVDIKNTEEKKEVEKTKKNGEPTPLREALAALFNDDEDNNISTVTPVSEQSIPPPSASMHPSGIYVLDVRVSLFPTVYGDAAVFRLLNRSDILIPLDELGMNTEERTLINELITRSYGMLLITGPSGSGKTTTLYSILQELKGKDKNIVTLEDPVEFYFGDIRQTQIRNDWGLTYAVGMRSILRQDPDVLMVGEIRDHETAEHAMRASLIGRLVGSTVHSNTTIGTIARLIDMNIDRSLIAYAVNGIIAQRLVRKLCEICKKSDTTPLPEALNRLNLTEKDGPFMKAGGCAECNDSGYTGRIGIYAVLVFTNTLRAMIVDKAPFNVLQEYVEKQGMHTLTDRAVEKVKAGITSLDEVVRAV
jgi:type II secretory ATPase GspE/PulE/Tfp pilus assembly ATPase PilB-like protein